MNIALEKTVEYVNGTKRRAYGDAFVRGNNGEWYPPARKRLDLTFGSHVYLGRLVMTVGLGYRDGHAPLRDNDDMPSIPVIKEAAASQNTMVLTSK